MDKSTLSQYGWVVICIIVIAILLGLATPFGNFVKDSVYNITTSFGQKVTASLDAAGTNNSGESSGSEESGNINESDLGELIQMWDISETPGAKKVWMTYYQPDMETVPATYGLRRSEGTTDRRYENGTVYIKGEGRMQDEVSNYFFDFDAVYEDIIAAMEEGLAEEHPGKEYTIELNTNSVGDLISLKDESLVAIVYGADKGGGDLRLNHMEYWEFDPSKVELYAFTPMTLIIDEGVTNISYSAFLNCANLTEVVFPDSIETIGEYAFAMTGIENLNIPDSVTDIGAYAFAGCSNLTSVTLSTNLTTIPEGAFYCCGNLLSVEVPSSVSAMNQMAFGDCTNLKTVRLNKGLKIIDDEVFTYCTNLESINLPDGLVELNYMAFFCCESLTNINIPGSVKVLEHSAFSNCKNLTSVILNEGLETIDGFVFAGTSLTELTIPESVKYISSQTFSINGGGINIIKGKNGSYAETWANNSGCTFVAI